VCQHQLRPSRWYDWSERQLAEQCIETLIYARTMDEDGRRARGAEEFAKKMLDEQGPGWAGLEEFKHALGGARRLFKAPELTADEQQAEQLKEDAHRLAENLVDAARRMINDQGFEPFLWPWVNALFESAALIG
jgi:hypothetical protein